jgi:hypothetical protein
MTSYEEIGSYSSMAIFPLMEEQRLRIFENRMLTRTPGLKRDEIMSGWRKLHNEALRNSYSSPFPFSFTSTDKSL